MRVFVDSSTIIALSKIGELKFLKDVFSKVYITRSIEKEILTPNLPETEVIKRVLGDWIVTVAVKGNTKQFKKYGLGEGEASLFLTEKEAMLVIDELNARRLADIEGRTYTGLLGLIVGARESRLIDKEKALAIIDKLSESSFRMSTALYKELIRRITR